MLRAIFLRAVAALALGAVLATTPLAGARICTDPAKLDCCPEDRTTLTESDCSCCFQLAEAASGRTASEKAGLEHAFVATLAEGVVPPTALRPAADPVIAARGDACLSSLRAVVLVI